MMNRTIRHKKTGGKFICPLLVFILSTSIVGGRAEARLEPETKMEREAREEAYISFVDSADYYASRNRWEEAEKFTLRALKIQPANKSNWLLWANLAEIRLQNNDEDGALEAYNIGLASRPDSKKMLEGRASLLISSGELEKAKEDLASILKNDSTDEWARRMRGFILLSEGRSDEAAMDFENLIRNHPKNAYGYYGLANIMAKENRNKEALDFYEKALECDGDEDIYIRYIALLADDGELPKASEALREAMKKFPRNGNMFLLRGYIHRLNYQNEEAEIAFKLAREYSADPALMEYFLDLLTTQRSKK